MNIIKVLGHTTWGSKTNTLIQIYKFINLLKLDYEACIWHTAFGNLLKTLDSIYNAGLHISLGVYKSSPIFSIFNLAAIPPLYIRRLQLDLT